MSWRCLQGGINSLLRVALWGEVTEKMGFQQRCEHGVCALQGLAEYCTLIDSSSSFRAYRAALADVEPPCIPYL